jgi:hypothetical protein
VAADAATTLEDATGTALAGIGRGKTNGAVGKGTVSLGINALYGDAPGTFSEKGVGV